MEDPLSVYKKQDMSVELGASLIRDVCGEHWQGLEFGSLTKKKTETKQRKCVHMLLSSQWHRELEIALAHREARYTYARIPRAGCLPPGILKARCSSARMHKDPILDGALVQNPIQMLLSHRDHSAAVSYMTLAQKYELALATPLHP